MSLDAIGIVSNNLAQSIKFYGLLGVELKTTGGEDHLEGATPSGVRIMVDSVELMKKLVSDWQAPTGSGIILCFKQDSAELVNQLFTKMVDSGFEAIKEPWDAFWGQRYSCIKDPDGNQIDLFATL